MRITRPADWFSRRSVELRRDGFTLVELTAVIFIVVVLVSLLSAALNHTKSKALRITCLDNMKQLQQAWSMYVLETEDALPLNQSSAEPPDGRYPEVQLSKNSWVAGNPRQDLTTENITRGTLYQHVGSTAPYRCPMDSSTVNGHPEVPRTRSYAMNSYLGGDPEYHPKFKYSEISRPDTVFVFIEEHESSRWHSSFLVPAPPRPGAISAASSAVWFSMPSDRHEQGCNISFADGHFEYWRWLAPKGPGDPGALHAAGTSSGLPQARDFMRLQSCLP
jgi:prepilin-type N-terminal cleavage/methylation domain-containing protein/prepilin-type processing-associated H-X9-DG protein